MRINLGAIASSIANKFTDSFNRANNGSELGRADDGSLWQAIRGTWQISGNTATTATAASSVPAAMVSVPGQSVTIDVVFPSNSAAGVGPMLWETDANNWWAVDVWQTSSNQCNAWAAAYNSYTTNYTYCAVPNYSTWCNAYSRGTCNGYNHAYYKNATYCQAYNFNCSGGYYTWASGCVYYASGSNTNYAFAGYYYCTSSSTVYPKYIRVLQMAAGTLSQITSTFIGYSVGTYSLRTILSGNQITARAYADGSFTSQVGGDLVYTATGATLSTNYGIKVSPSDINASSSFDSITITRND